MEGEHGVGWTGGGQPLGPSNFFKHSFSPHPAAQLPKTKRPFLHSESVSQHFSSHSACVSITVPVRVVTTNNKNNIKLSF